MSIISKICVLFLAWTVVGALSIVAHYFVGVIKLYTMEKKMGLSKSELSKDIDYLSSGTTEADDSIITFKERIELLGKLMILGMLWPAILAYVDQMMNERIMHIKESRRNSKELG